MFKTGNCIKIANRKKKKEKKTINNDSALQKRYMTLTGT